MPNSASGRHPVLRLAGIGAFVLAAGAFAQEAAHEHGVARLDVAVDGGTLELALEGPGDGFVGFEHAPESAEDRAAFARAEAQLKQGAALFALPAAAGCTLAAAEVAPPAAEADAHHDEDAADHDDEAAHHDEDAEAHHDDETAHGDEDAHHGKEHAHADWRASWRFDCATPAALDAIEVKLIAAFPQTRELRVQATTAAGQTGATLTADAPRIELDAPQ